MRGSTRRLAFALLGALGAACALAADKSSSREAAIREIRAWRAQQQADFRSEKSPLAVERVVILKKSENTIGSGPQADVRLEAPGVAAQAALAVIHNGQCTIRLLAPGGNINGDTKLREKVMHGPDRVAIGPYGIKVRRPEGQFALRITNANHPALKAFRGLDYYPTDLAYRVPATFHRHATERHVTIEATQGGPQDYILAGYLDFQLKGRALRLDALIEPDDPDILFIIYKDLTNGRGSYKVGRYIDVKIPSPPGRKPAPAGHTFSWKDIPERLDVTLDFNQSYNPLCAYGPFFFCPIPPKQNHLAVEIPAGQKDYRRAK